MKTSIQTLFGIACCLFMGMGSVVHAQDPPVSSEIVVEEIDSSQYQDYMIKHSRVVVDIYAPWCPPCHRLAPIVHEVAQVYSDPIRGESRICFVKMNLDNNRQLGSKLGVRSIPTLVFYLNGEEVGRVVGVLTATELKAKIQEYLFVK